MNHNFYIVLQNLNNVIFAYFLLLLLFLLNDKFQLGFYNNGTIMIQYLLYSAKLQLPRFLIPSQITSITIGGHFDDGRIQRMKTRGHSIISIAKKVGTQIGENMHTVCAQAPYVARSFMSTYASRNFSYVCTTRGRTRRASELIYVRESPTFRYYKCISYALGWSCS